MPREEPIGRFAQLKAETKLLEPYEITASLKIQPPDKARLASIIATQTTYSIARGQMEAMISPLTDENGEIIKDEAGQPILPQLNVKHLEQLQELVAKSAEEYDRALFGDAYESVMAYFQDEQGVMWSAFYKDVQDEFLPIPDSGKCPTCGHVVDQEQAGKPPESSVSSNGTGTT